MPTVSDARFDALRASGFTGASSDMLLQWLQSKGATSKNINDAWREFLDIVVVSPTGQWNDDWFTYLGTEGHEGSLSDRQLAFWIVQGSAPPVVLLHALFNGAVDTNIDVYTCDEGGPFVYPNVGIDYSLDGTGRCKWAVGANGPEFSVVSANAKVTGVISRAAGNLGFKARNSSTSLNASSAINCRYDGTSLDLRYAGTTQNSIPITDATITAILAVEGVNVSLEAVGETPVSRSDAPSDGTNFGFFNSHVDNFHNEHKIEEYP